MKAVTSWSFAPYTPPLFDSGDIYVCRIAPYEAGFRCEWLAVDGAIEYTVKYGLRGGEMECELRTAECFADITGLSDYADYEFQVFCGDKKSRMRLVRTGMSVGSVVNYLHPDDECYSFSGRSLCSPSLVRHPDGYLLASMDVFAGGRPQNLTLISAAMTKARPGITSANSCPASGDACSSTKARCTCSPSPQNMAIC